MLKPRKKITRKEIKKDPILEKVAKTYSFIQNKQKVLTRIGIGAVSYTHLTLPTNREV